MKLFPHFAGSDDLEIFIYNEAAPSGNRDGGPLKVEDIEDLDAAERSEAELAEIQAALTKANKILDGEPRDLTLTALKKVDADGRFTMADIQELDTFAPRIKAKLEELRAKKTKEQGIDTNNNSGMDLGLGLAEVEQPPADDLGLGLAPVAPAANDDLGLGLATTDAPADTLTGSAGTDDLGLGLAETPVEPSDEKVETVSFTPNAERCQNCAVRVVEDFEAYPAQAQEDVVARLVLKETDEKRSIDDVDPAEVKANCDVILARYEKASLDTETTSLAEAETDDAREAEAKNNEANEALISALEQRLEANQLTQPEIVNILSDEAGWTNIKQLPENDTRRARLLSYQQQLIETRKDLSSVASIAPPDNPQEAQILQDIVTSTPVSWKAESPSVRYAAIITAIHAGNLSDDTKRRAQEALGIRINTVTPRVNSGTDVEDAMANGRGTETRFRTERVEEPPGSGQYVEKQVPYEVPLDYDEKNPLEVRPGVEAYKDGNREIMKATAGHNVPATIDVTGWTAEQKGDLAEVMSFWTATESVGMTGFVQDIYGLNFSESTAFNPDQVRQMKQVITYAFGGFEGHDGDIGSFDRQMGLIQYQARLVSETGTATGMENDQASTQGMVSRLGLRTPQGDLNHDVVRAFGAYTLSTYGTGEATTADLQAHLHGLFPDLVEAPEGREAA